MPLFTTWKRGRERHSGLEPRSSCQKRTGTAFWSQVNPGFDCYCWYAATNEWCGDVCVLRCVSSNTRSVLWPWSFCYHPAATESIWKGQCCGQAAITESASHGRTYGQAGESSKGQCCGQAAVTESASHGRPYGQAGESSQGQCCGQAAATESSLQFQCFSKYSTQIQSFHFFGQCIVQVKIALIVNKNCTFHQTR